MYAPTHRISYSESGRAVWSFGAEEGIPVGTMSQQFYQPGNATLHRVRTALQQALAQVDGQISLMSESL